MDAFSCGAKFVAILLVPGAVVVGIMLLVRMALGHTLTVQTVLCSLGGGSLAGAVLEGATFYLLLRNFKM